MSRLGGRKDHHFSRLLSLPSQIVLCDMLFSQVRIKMLFVKAVLVIERLKKGKAKSESKTITWYLFGIINFANLFFYSAYFYYYL